jgi:hypothetical protein
VQRPQLKLGLCRSSACLTPVSKQCVRAILCLDVTSNPGASSTVVFSHATGLHRTASVATCTAVVNLACLSDRQGLECGAVSTFYHAQLLTARIQDACTLTEGLTGRVWCGLGRVALTGAAPVTKHTGAIGKQGGMEGPHVDVVRAQMLSRWRAPV